MLQFSLEFHLPLLEGRLDRLDAILPYAQRCVMTGSCVLFSHLHDGSLRIIDDNLEWSDSVNELMVHHGKLDTNNPNLLPNLSDFLRVSILNFPQRWPVGACEMPENNTHSLRLRGCRCHDTAGS